MIPSKKLALWLRAMRRDIYTLVFLALITFKVSTAAIHIHLHHGHDDGHEDQCELCEHAIYHQNLEFSTPTDLVSTEAENTPDQHRPINLYESVDVDTFLNNTLFGRPPPCI